MGLSDHDPTAIFYSKEAETAKHMCSTSIVRGLVSCFLGESASLSRQIEGHRQQEIRQMGTY
eukprot:6178856-Amphidinium_carterae.1